MMSSTHPLHGITTPLSTGRLGTDPEVKYLDNGNCVLSIGLAVRRDYPSKAEMDQSVDWIRIEAWGGVAENIAQNAQKGSRLVVLGRLTVSSWTDKYGQSRSDVRVKVKKVEILDLKPRSSNPELKYNTAWEGGEQQQANPMGQTGGYQQAAPFQGGNYQPRGGGYSGGKKTYEATKTYESRGTSPNGGYKKVYSNDSRGSQGQQTQYRAPQQQMVESVGGEDMYDIDADLPF